MVFLNQGIPPAVYGFKGRYVGPGGESLCRQLYSRVGAFVALHMTQELDTDDKRLHISHYKTPLENST